MGLSLSPGWEVISCPLLTGKVFGSTLSPLARTWGEGVVPVGGDAQPFLSLLVFPPLPLPSSSWLFLTVGGAGDGVKLRLSFGLITLRGLIYDIFYRLFCRIWISHSLFMLKKRCLATSPIYKCSTNEGLVRRNPPFWKMRSCQKRRPVLFRGLTVRATQAWERVTDAVIAFGPNEWPVAAIEQTRSCSRIQHETMKWCSVQKELL